MKPTGSLSTEAQTQLNALRSEIDSVDKELVSLLKKRIEIVSKVGALKRQDGSLQCFIRSGREADMLRDIFQAFNKSNFHPLAACAIWRQIIAASTQHESPMHIITPPALQPLAQSYFSELKPVIHSYCIQDSLDALAKHPNALIILPLWQDELQSWRDFSAQAPATTKVFAAIPFVGSKPKAFVAANLTPEPSRDDISLFLNTQTGQIEEIDGYHSEVAVASGQQTSHKQWLGTYARPIGEII